MSGLFDLQGKTALVTGATGGLGVSIVHALAEQGANLLVSDWDTQSCEVLVQQLRSKGAVAHAISADLAEPASVDALARGALELAGGVDILVCNAGIQGPAGSLTQVSDADWEKVIQVNVRSTLQLCNALMPKMASRGQGSVVLISSIAGLRGNKAIGLYGLSKAAIAQLARNLAVEWGPQGVRCNALSPGLIRTPLATRLLNDEQFMQKRLQMTPLRRVGEPQEVAGAVVFLASQAGGFVNGHNLVVDGGTTISDGS
jgi:NAD(P)-dependent dehydrogenase (short-subunit alcohol dehydrogenase family)